ncbi:hypothetical protein D3C71_1242090 [compost metagenome]
MTDIWVDIAGKDYRPSLMQEEKEIRAILARDFSARLLNNTKWRELLTALEQLSVSYLIKFVDVSSAMHGSLSHRTDKFYDSEWGPVPILAVEWIEVEHSAPEVIELLGSLNLPYKLEPSSIRIIGHLRKGEHMPPNNSFKPKR